MAAPGNSIDVLDRGFVRLDAVMADDLSVVNAARVSFGARVDTMDDRNAGLVRFLMRERHGTPFEHNFFRFHIKAPLFVTREWQRHRVGSFNERSGRYSELPDEFYVPAAGDVRTQVGKPGAYTFEPLAEDEAERVRAGIEASYAESYRTLPGAARRRCCQGGRAQRPAGRPLHRVLLVGQRALADELPLAAQLGDGAARRYWVHAEAAEQHFAQAMPVTHAAFLAQGRTAP